MIKQSIYKQLIKRIFGGDSMTEEKKKAPTHTNDVKIVTYDSVSGLADVRWLRSCEPLTGLNPVAVVSGRLCDCWWCEELRERMKTRRFG